MNTSPSPFGTPTSQATRKYGGQCGYGHVPDPVGHRATGFHIISDSIKSQLKDQGLTSLPRSSNNRRFIAKDQGGPGILNQRRTGSCTGHATEGGICVTNAIAGTPTPLGSPIGNYALSRIIDRIDKHTPLIDAGAEPNQNWRARQEYGSPTVAEWGGYILDKEGNPLYPDETLINEEPPVAGLQNASARIQTGPYKILTTGKQYILDVILALTNKTALPTAIQVDTPFEAYSGGVVGAPNFRDILGGHYIYLIDFEWDGNDPFSIEVVGASSWDTTWGEDGLFRGNANFLLGTRDTYYARATPLLRAA